MPLDPIFKSDFKKKPTRRTVRAEESIEMQIGRSDFLLGTTQRQNPFNDSHAIRGERSDASEWSRGFLSEKQVELRNRAAGEKANPPWKRRKPRA